MAMHGVDVDPIDGAEWPSLVWVAFGSRKIIIHTATQTMHEWHGTERRDRLVLAAGGAAPVPCVVDITMLQGNRASSGPSGGVWRRGRVAGDTRPSGRPALARIIGSPNTGVKLERIPCRSAGLAD
jgi:hypothetical protein